MAAYALTIGAGAFLLFQVQPLMGKFLLPWFGGGPGVWTTCLLFFQVMLLAGYAYAHGSARRLGARAQVALHALLVLGALALLPVTPAEAWKPAGAAHVTWRLLGTLAASVGVPYLVLAATGPLLQHWFSRIWPATSPYRLYALSSGASLLALLSYPVVFEAHFTRQAQARMWGWGMVFYALGCAWCGLKYWRADSINGEEAKPRRDEPEGLPPTWLQRLLWLLLPASASVLLMATTNKLCQDLAAVPFLWVLPLSLYLLSFIIAFDHPRWYRWFPSMAGLALAMAGFFWVLGKGAGWPLWKQLALYSPSLLIACLVCHGEVFRLRPPPHRLTGFYLTIAGGGALGGWFVAVLAPVIFRSYAEVYWGLGLCGLLSVLAWTTRGTRWWPERAEAPLGNAWRVGRWWRGLAGLRTGHRDLHRLACTFLWLACVTVELLLWVQSRATSREIIETSRSFYGVLTVYEHQKDEPAAHRVVLRHGRIIHGLQFTDPSLAALPTTYYGPESGVGRALAALPGAHRRIGLVGLGAGTLLAYARPGDYLRVYEINPEVHRLAASRFTYLADCKGRVEVHLGDARLSLERERPQQFDLLALDAFSGDSIPVHLLTRQAFELYSKHLATNGVLAVHISNHFLDLEPVVANAARHCGYRQVLIDYNESDEKWWLYSCTWMLLSRNEALFRSPGISTAAAPSRTNAPSGLLWTDDYASLLHVLRR